MTIKNMLKSALLCTALMGLPLGAQAGSEACDLTLPALAIVTDQSSERTEGEKADLRAYLDTVSKTTEPGRPVFGFTDAGNGRAVRDFGPICRAAECPTSFLAAVGTAHGRTCRRGDVAAQNAFFEAEVSGAFASYFADGDAPQSRLTAALADMVAQLRREGVRTAAVTFFSDAILNDHSLGKYAPGAAWLKDTPARAKLFEQLEQRGELPDLTLFSIRFIGVGRPQGEQERLANTWDSPEATAELKGFWTAFVRFTGAAISFHPTLSATDI